MIIKNKVIMLFTRFNILQKISVIEDFVLVFLFVFGLSVPFFGTTSLLLLFVLPFRLSLIKGGILYPIRILKSKYVVSIIASYFILVIIITLSTTLHLKYDFSLIPTIINTLIHLVVSILLISLFIIKKRSISSFLNLIIYIFFAQSIIQLLAFFSPAVLDIVHIFQPESSIELADKFSGRRGLALAGTLFFGLSSIYGVAFLFLVHRCVRNGFIIWSDILVFSLFIIGGFFTGRTFFIGVAVSLMYLVLAPIAKSEKLKFVSRLVLFILCVVALVLAIIPPELYKKVYNLIWYVFEFVFNYLSTGHATTTSTNNLFQNMYFEIPASTFLFGDGLYSGDTTTYYMGTDAGYMRNILLYGIVGLFFTMLPDLLLIFTGYNSRVKSEKLFSVFILIYMLILHVKGEVFGYLITLHTMLFTYYILINNQQNKV